MKIIYKVQFKCKISKHISIINTSFKNVVTKITNFNLILMVMHNINK